MLKNNVLFLLVLVSTPWLNAQLEINAPYSRFGLGNLNRSVSVFNEGMAGVATSYTSSDDINTLNPALLYRTRLTTFELGASHLFLSAAQDQKINQSSNFQFDYLNLAFPVHPKYTFALGLRPFSSVSYETQSITQVDSEFSVRDIYKGQGEINAVSFSNSYAFIRDTVNSREIALGFDASLLIGSSTISNNNQNILSGAESNVRTSISDDRRYRGGRYKLGASYRQELFTARGNKSFKKFKCGTKTAQDTVMVTDKYWFPEEAEATAQKSFETQYAIIFVGRNSIRLMSSIKSADRREQLQRYYAGFVQKNYGVFVKKSAEGQPYEVVKESYLEAIAGIKANELKQIKSDPKTARNFIKEQSGVFVNAGLAYELATPINFSSTTNVVRFNSFTNNEVDSYVLSEFEDEKLTLPQTLHLGLSIDKPTASGRNYCGEKKKSAWVLGADLSLTNWSVYEGRGITEKLSNTARMAVGGSITPDPNTNAITGISRLFKKITYRSGVYYQTLPYSINSEQITELGINFGLSVPANYNGGTFTLNFGYARRGVDLVENYFKTSIGLTLNEGGWFAKRKIGL